MNHKKYSESNVANVKLNGGIFRQYQDIVKKTAIPYQWEILNDKISNVEKSGAIENFRIAAGESQCSYYGTCFQDSDVGKWLEGVAYLLGWTENAELEKTADEVIELLGRAQQKDGYLNTYFTVVNPEGRFTNIRECDELYCFGHLAEAAVAYYESTGKRRFLDIICRYADLICKTFGEMDGQIRACDGHPEAELAFVRLYEATGEERYLEQAGFQLKTRGSEPYYYDIEWERRGRKSFHPHLQGEKPSDDRGYDQAECLLKDLDHPVGHAVKMGYLLAGMAAYCFYTNEEELHNACRKIFEVITSKQMYLTGAVGSTRHKEAFTRDYHLPNDRAYAETCASVAIVLAAQRMLRLEANPYYADIIERVVYNALPAGISLEGDRFFYVNPLEVYPPDIEADHDYDSVKPVRQKWFWCACCPPNLIRLFTSLGKYLYTYSDTELYINLFAQSEADIELKKGKVIHVIQRTEYPWDGDIKITVMHAKGIDVNIRIPAWCTKVKMAVNGKEKEISINEKAQYALIKIQEDITEINVTFDMTPYCVSANPKVKADAGKIAVMRGPIVYCAEEIDNGALLHNLAIDPTEGFDVLPETCFGAPVICAKKGLRINNGKWERELYRRYCKDSEMVEIRLIPYGIWGNRGEKDIPQEMQVWLLVHEE